MAKRDNIYFLCGICGGDGIITTPSPEPPHEIVDRICHACLGKGAILWGWLEKEDEPPA